MAAALFAQGAIAVSTHPAPCPAAACKLPAPFSTLMATRVGAAAAGAFACQLFVFLKALCLLL